MLRVLRRYGRAISLFLLFSFIAGSFPQQAFALTSGPAQPETQQFAPASMDNMVDPFTGDFSYNIPLLDVGGYPININYAGGITPDQEASWVGLGWNLNVGAVNRSVRGIPDDFAGDQITTEHKLKPNQTFGLTFAPSAKQAGELFTFPVGFNQNYNISYNTYTGFGFSVSYTPSLDIALLPQKQDSKYKMGVDLEPSISLSVGSEDGVGISPSIGLKTSGTRNGNEATLNAKIGFPFSTREGAKGMSMSASFNYSSSPYLYSKVKDPEPSGSENKHSSGFSHGSFKGFATPTYTTAIQNDVYSVNGTLDVSPEKLKVFLKDKTRFVLGGYYHGQFDKRTNESNSAYGYLYEGISSDSRSVLDFNREKDGGYNENTTNMPVTNHTYDVFSVQGEGVGGAYRIFRSDVPVVGDNEHTDEAISPSLAVSGGFNTDIGWKNIKIGVDFKYIQSDASAGRWVTNQLQQSASPEDPVNAIQQNVYFGKIGDMAPENNLSYYDNTLFADKLYEYRLMNGYATGEYLDKSNGTGFLNKKGSPNYIRDKRRNRNNSFTYLTAAKAATFAASPIYSYDSTFAVIRNNPSVFNARKDLPVDFKKDKIDRVDQEKKGHHISEVRVTNNTGSRYIYGIPVYNREQHEVTFSADLGSQDLYQVRSSGLIQYDPAKDPTLSNKNGLEHYYQRTITPANASSYLLTYILSSDYMDSDGVTGPSDGDLGTYVKFNYTRTSTDYKWRTPFQKNMANFADGLAGKRDDDKGSYTYGKKEIWYLHSIETRTHIAEFHLKDRLDGIGATDEAGGLAGTTMSQIPDGSKLKCIDKILLFAKADKLNGRNEPLKTVHFEYDYSLCPNTPNSLASQTINSQTITGGKLTLKKLWFTYGFSNKGVLNPYSFDYADVDFDGSMDVNFPYSSKNYDRWGVYKQQDALIGNEAFPYTNQAKSLTDKFASAYSITRIQTPTGGEMRVHYESDDYGYVQNQQAMRMFAIKGVSASLADTNTASNEFYGSGDGLQDKLYLYIDLKEGFTASDATAAKNYFIKNYLGDINELQYKVKINVISQTGAYETVPGYCLFNHDPAQINVIANSGGVYKYAVIQLNSEALNRGGLNRNIHPFVKNGWLYARLQYNREMMGSANAEDNGFLQVVGAIASSMNSVLNLFFGFRLYMKLNNNSRYFIPQESFVRLNEHDKMKLGGGHRVKAILMFDRWSDMKSDREKSNAGAVAKEQAGYGQIYDYTMPEDVTDPATRTISSGVAAYEPVIGGEENPIRKLVKTTDHVPLAPDKEYYSETPYGESFFPAPVVGYRKVRTIPVKVPGSTYTVNSLTSNGTGYVEQEFYTAYDFPTYTSQTDLGPYRDKSSKLNPLKIKSSDFVSCSQGYLIELNDMHGKPRSTKVMPDGASGNVKPISYVTYIYRTKQTDGARLENLVPLVDRNLNVTSSGEEQIGVSVDVVTDTRYSKSLTSGGGADVNVKISLSPPFPYPPVFLPVISAFPDINYERTVFSSITTTKVVNRNGILVKTIAQDNGQTITTENLAWDQETGDVLLTKVQNEFHDPLYNFTYPAHWAYRPMELAYQNEGFQFDNLGSSVTSLLKDGDEVICTTTDAATPNVYAYFDKYQNQLLDKTGKVVTNLKWAQVVRSGARNLAMTPIATVASINNPIAGNKISFASANVLNAGASEFKYVWKGFCNCGEQSKSINNPFTTGQRGMLRPWRSWTYLTERTQTITSGEVNIRKDGYFSDYKDFWNPGGVYLDPFYVLPGTDNYKWQSVTQIMNYNPLGMEIENKDTLGRYSMAQFGYGRNLPVATSNNSQYQETGYDGFEDYDYGDCNDDHFSWRVRKNDPNQGLVNTEAHTGRKSFKVAPKSKAGIIKIIDPCGAVEQ